MKLTIKEKLAVIFLVVLFFTIMLSIYFGYKAIV